MKLKQIIVATTSAVCVMDRDGKGLQRNNMADITLRFGLDLDVVIEKNRKRSWATSRILRLNNIQI